MVNVVNEEGIVKATEDIIQEIEISKASQDMVLDTNLCLFGNLRNKRYWMYQWLYEKVTWLYASAQLIGNSAISSGYKIIPNIDVNKNGVEDTEDALAIPNDFIKNLEKLFEHANSEQTFLEIYKQIHIDLSIAGKAYIIFDYLNDQPPFGIPIAMYRADFKTMHPVYLWDFLQAKDVPDAEARKYKNKIIGWSQEVIDNLEGFIEKKGQESPPGDLPSWMWNGGANTRFFYPDQVLEIRLDASGTSPLDCLEYSVATELAAQLYTYAYFKNGTKAGIILSMEKGTEKDAKMNKEWIKSEYASPENAWYPMLLLGGIKLVRESANTSDVKYLEIRDFNREECCAAMGTYPSLIGAGSNSNTANREEDKLSFESETVRPREILILSKIQRHIEKMFPDQSGKFKIVPGIKSRASLHLIKVAQMQTMFGGTINEARGLIGLPLDKSNKIYDKPMVAVNLLPADIAAEKVTANNLGSKSSKDNNPGGQNRNENVQGGKSGVMNEQRIDGKEANAV